MKLRAPEGCCAASHAGRAIEISAEGSAEVEDDLGAVLLVHGFTHWEITESRPASAAIRGQLIAPAIALPVKTAPFGRPKAIFAKPALAEEAASDERSGSVAETMVSGLDEISTLSRRELFALLREQGVSVSLPITNEELRAAARRAVGAAGEKGLRATED